MKLPALFKNKYFGYGVIILGAIHVLGYMGEKAWECLVFFGLTCIAVERKFKNMSLAILSGLFLANVIFGCGRAVGVSEGFLGDYFKTSADHIREGMTNMDKAAKAAKKEAFKEGLTCDAGTELSKDGKKCVAIAKEKAGIAEQAAETIKKVGATVNEADSEIKKEKAAEKAEKAAKKVAKKEEEKGVDDDIDDASKKLGEEAENPDANPEHISKDDEPSGVSATLGKEAEEKEEEEGPKPPSPDSMSAPESPEDAIAKEKEGFQMMNGGAAIGINRFAQGVLTGGDTQQEHFDNGTDIYNKFLNDAKRGGELIDGIRDPLIQEGFMASMDNAAMDLRFQKYGQYNPNNVGY